MEPEIIKKSGKYYYEGELSAGKLLSKEPLEKSNEIIVNKFDAVILGDRTFLLNPSTEEFMSLQFRNGNYEYIYKSGENCIVRDEDGNEILPKFWIEKGLQVVTSEGIGIVETFTDNVALVKSQTGLKNYYIKGLKPVEDKTDFQRYRTAWTKYNDLLPIIKEEIKSDKTRLIKGAFDEAFKNLDAQMPKKVETPETPKMEIPKVETPSVEPIKEKKQGVMGRIKNFFSKKTPTPTPTPDPQINVNHNIATPPDVSSVKPNTSNPAHLDKQYVHTDKSNLEGIANHAITHIDLNPNSQNDTDKYLYHYEVGSHRDPIVTNKYLDEKGFSADHYGNNIKEPGLTKNGVYVPGERVIDKATGEEHEVVSHIDRNPMTHVINTKNILVRGSDGNIKTLDKDNIQLSSADRTSHSIVNTESGNKHLHDIKEGDVINHEDNKHSVLFSDPEKGLGTINQSTGQMHFTSARDYHKPYLGEAKPIVKEGMTVQIGKSKYKVEHVGGEDKGHSILSKTDKLGNKEYFEHPTEKLHSKILKPADLQDYKGNRFDPKQPETPEGAEGVDSAKEVFKQRTTHPDLKEDDINHLKDNVGMTTEEINNTSPEDMQKLISDKPAPSSNPIPETADPEQVAEQKRLQQETEKKEKHTKNVEHLDSVFGEHNKTEHSDGSVTHRLGVGDLGLKTTPEGKKEVVNPEVQLTKAKGLIVTDIDPVRKIVTTRKKGDVKGKKIEYSFDEFKTEVRENEKHEPSTQVDIKNKQIKHKDEFQQKVIQSTSKHLSEKGIKPTQENIDKELNTSNSELRAEVEKHHKNYERNHNREKSAGSIVDHPEYDKLDIDKNLKEITDLEGNVKRTRDSKRGELKDHLVEDLVDYHKNENTPYSRDHNYDADTGIKEDMEEHRNLGGKDEDIHSEVENRLGQEDKYKKHQEELEAKRKLRSFNEKKAAKANEDREKMSNEEYVEKVYNKKPDVKDKSINESHGVKGGGKLAFNNNPTYHNTEFEHHIVPRSSITVSHTPLNTEDHKTPFMPNAEHPATGQGREGYHSTDLKGESDRKKVMEIAKAPEHDQWINTSRNAAEQAPPLIDSKGNAINNGRFMAMDMMSEEEKGKYKEHLKTKLPELFPDATPEQHEKMKQSIDEMHNSGDMPIATRIPINKNDNKPYNLAEHGDDYGAFAGATNNKNTKSMSNSEVIGTVQKSLTHEDKKRLNSYIPPDTTVGNHIKDVKKADVILDDLEKGGKLSDTERATMYGEDRRLNDKGKQYIQDIYNNMYFSDEHNKLAGKNKLIAQKITDFQKKHSDNLRDAGSHSEGAYDLKHDLTDALTSMIRDKKESDGQGKIEEDSNTVKGLRYLIEHGQKGKDSAGNEFNDAHDALTNYNKSSRAAGSGGDMFGSEEVDSKELKNNFFKKYADLYDKKKELGDKKPPKGSDPDPEDPEDPGDPPPPNDPVPDPVPPSGENILKGKDGNKQVMYHGTGRNLGDLSSAKYHIDSNSPNYGTYVTSDPEQASDYATGGAGNKGGANVHPIHVNARKIAHPDDEKEVRKQHPDLKGDQVYEKMIELGYDAIDWGGSDNKNSVLQIINPKAIIPKYGGQSSPKKDLPIESPQLKEEGKEQKGKKVEKSYPTVMPIFTDPLNSLLKSFNESELPPIEEIAHNYLRNGIKYHGTSNHSITNKILPPQTTGVLSEVGRKKNLNKVFYTDTENSAKIYAGRAKNSYGGTPKVHRVIPMGDLETLNDTKGTEVHHSDYGVVVTPELESRLNQHLNITNPLQKSQRTIPISSVAVMNGNKILMGRRRDTDKWTLPGGHAEGNETPHEAGLRELEEETGIKADKLKPLGSDMVTRENKQLMINAFRYDTDESTTIKDDPDMEVKKWVWISTPISEEILDNLHAKKNVTLHLLGLQK